MFFLRQALIVATILIPSSIEIIHAMSYDNSSECESVDIDDYASMSLDDAYRDLSTAFPISQTDWSNPAAVNDRKTKLKIELAQNRPAALLEEASEISKHLLNDQLNSLCNSFCLFEKLYAKYSSTKEVSLSIEEYCTVFSIMQNYENSKNKTLYNGDCFNRIGVHWLFVIKKASTDVEVLNNTTIQKTYIDMLNSELGYSVQYSMSSQSLGVGVRWNMAYSLFYSDPIKRLYCEYENELRKIQKKLQNLANN